MAVEVILPKVDMDMETGRILRWLVEEGASVRKGDLLFEIETDKAAMEIDAPADGILSSVSGTIGVDIPIGSRVAMILEAGEVASAPVEPAASAPQTPLPVAETVTPAAAPAPLATPDANAAAGLRATPLARKLAREGGVVLGNLQGSGPKGRIQARDVEAALEAGPLADALPAPQARTCCAPAASPAVPLQGDAGIRLSVRVEAAAMAALVEQIAGAGFKVGLGDLAALAFARVLGAQESLAVIALTSDGETGGLIEKAGLASLRAILAAMDGEGAMPRARYTCINAVALGFDEAYLPLETGQDAVLVVGAPADGQIFLSLSASQTIGFRAAAKLLVEVRAALGAPLSLLA